VRSRPNSSKRSAAFQQGASCGLTRSAAIDGTQIARLAALFVVFLLSAKASSSEAIDIHQSVRLWCVAVADCVKFAGMMACDGWMGEFTVRGPINSEDLCFFAKYYLVCVFGIARDDFNLFCDRFHR
jgi:hypothetical protein